MFLDRFADFGTICYFGGKFPWDIFLPHKRRVNLINLYLIDIFLNFLFHRIEFWSFSVHLIEEEGDQAMSSWSFLARGVALPWNTNTDLTFSNKHFGHRTSLLVVNIRICKKAFHWFHYVSSWPHDHSFRRFSKMFYFSSEKFPVAKFLTHKKR